LISKFRLVVNVLCFLLDNSPAPEIYMPTFRNTLFHLHSPMKMEQTECSETSAYKFETLRSYPEASVQQISVTGNDRIRLQNLKLF